MATHAHTPGAPARAPSIGRRTLLAGFAALPAAALPALAAAPLTDRAAWTAAVARLEAAERATAAQDQVWRPLADKLDRLAPRPPFWFEGPPARDGYKPEFHLYTHDLHRWDHYPVASVREEAARQREAWQHRLATAERIGEAAAANLYQEHVDAECDCRSELLTTPAPDLVAFHWKLDYLFGEPGGREEGEPGDAYCGEWIDAVMADARRLLVGGRA